MIKWTLKGSNELRKKPVRTYSNWLKWLTNPVQPIDLFNLIILLEDICILCIYYFYNIFLQTTTQKLKFEHHWSEPLQTSSHVRQPTGGQASSSQTEKSLPTPTTHGRRRLPATFSAQAAYAASGWSHQSPTHGC